MEKSIKLLIAYSLFPLATFAQVADTLQTDAVQQRERSVEYGRGISFDLKESTTATASASASDLSHKKTINPSNILYGQIAGLQVLQNANNAWNDGATLYVRGLGTTSSNAPLILVDGIERSLDVITVDEIESVTVLKEAVSTALYGIRGANGVVLVTTKRGLESAPVINFSYQFNMGTPRRLPKFVDGYTYAQALNEGLTNDGLLPRYSKDELDAFRDQTYPGFYPNVNWVDETIRDHSYGDNVTFSATGGGTNVKYYTQLNFVDDRGILRPKSDNDGYSTQFKFSKLNIRTNLDIKIGNSTKVKLNLLGSFSEHNRPGASTGNIFAALYQVPAGAFPIKTNRGIWGGTSVYANNPVAQASATGTARSQARNMMADIQFDQRLDFLTKGLSAGARVAIDNYGSYWDNNTKNFGYESATINLATKEETYNTLRNEGTLAFSSSTGGYTNFFEVDAWLNYDKQWKKHALNTTLNYSMSKLSNKGMNTSRAFMDVVGMAHYTYNKRYALDASLSASASSVLDPDKRWGIFPAVGAAWLISEESFLKTDWIDMLKLRASYGISGRADYAVNLYKDLYNTGGSYLFKDTPTALYGLTETQLGVKNLTYEKSHKFNAGIDFQALGKLSLTLDGFYDHRTDILVASNGKYSTILGINPPTSNDGIVDNYGVEVAARWNETIGQVNYQLGAQFSYVRSKVKEMNEVYRPEDYLKRTGQPVGQIFGYEVIGIYQNQAEIDNRPVKQYLSDVRPGDLMYKDQNGDNRIDEYDMVPLGYNTLCPEIYYSFDLGAEYKGFGFYAMFQGAGNYSRILNTQSLFIPLIGNSTVSEHYYNNRWTPETPNARYPRLTSASSDNNFTNNSVWVADASFLKLRTLELYYQVPTKTLKPLKVVSKAKVFARAHDLITWDNIKVADPESIGATHPTMTQYAFGINLSF